MRKFKLTALIALCLVAVMLFASCGGAGKVKELSFKKVVDYEAPETKSVTMTALTNLAGNIVDTNEELIYLEEYEAAALKTQIVYNIQLNKVVYSRSAAANVDVDIGINDTEDYSYFVVQVEDYSAASGPVVEKTYLYRADGELIAEATGLLGVDTSFDLIRFNGVVYRLTKDGDTYGAAALEGVNALTALPNNIECANDKYYYVFTGGNRMFVYDKANLNIVSTYYFEQNGAVHGVLDNGDVLVQYAYQLPFTAEKYTYFNAGGNKFQLKTVLVDPKKGTAKEIDFGYVIDFVVCVTLDNGYDAVNENEFLSKNVKNVANITPIEDKRLVTNVLLSKLVTISSSGKIEGDLGAVVDGQNPAAVVRPIGNGYYRVPATDDSILILNKDGKLVGSVDGGATFTYAYIYSNGRVFDYELTEKFNYVKEGYDLYTCMNRSAIFTKEDATTAEVEYYLYYNGALTKIDAANDNFDFMAANQIGYYSIVDNTDPLNPKRAYYNETGAKILDLTTSYVINVVSTYAGQYTLFRGTDPTTGKPVYYYFSNK